MVQATGLETRSLFLSFVLSFAFCSLLPPYAHQLPLVGVGGFTFCPDPFFFVLSFLSLFLALLRADTAVAG